MAWFSFLIQLVVENLLYQITGKPSLFIRALTGQQWADIENIVYGAISDDENFWGEIMLNSRP